MGCSGCSSGGCKTGGCTNKGGGCNSTYGSNRLDVFDWLSGMQLPDNQKSFDIVEVRFKNNRKAFYRVNQEDELYVGDTVTVDVSPGYDVGVISLSGELVRAQMKRKAVKDNYEIKKVLHRSKENEIAKWHEARKLEQGAMMRGRTIAKSLGLQMKISDVEYQGDKTKATFYYTAEDRVDFRELIRKFAEEFRVKIEMRQISYRHEAARIGGISSSGRELCCSTWMTDFRAVSTSAARYQQLSLNPAKLTGQCGKLKCCLNFELDQYVEALKEFPSVSTRLQLVKGTAVYFKTDVFKHLMYFVYEGQHGEAPFPLHIEAIKEIIEKNKKGIVIEDVNEFIEEETVTEVDFAQVVGQDTLTRFDKKKRSSRQRDNRRKPIGKGRNEKQGEVERRPTDKKEGKTPQELRKPQGPQRPNNQKPQQVSDSDKPNQQRQGVEPKTRKEGGSNKGRLNREKGSSDKTEGRSNSPKPDNA